MDNLIEISSQMAHLKQTKSLKQISEKTGYSVSKISRLVSFSKLDDCTKKRVVKGELSFENSIKKATKKKRAISKLSQSDYDLLDLISVKKWVISEQVSIFQNISLPEARRRLERLVSFEYVEKFTEISPYAFRLSHKAASRLNVNLPKHYMSGSAIHQNVLKNDVEIFYKKSDKNFRLISRVKCWDLGLFPAHAEYLLSNGKKNILVIIDDYQMRPARIQNSLTRIHDKNGSILDKPFKICWQEFVVACHVFTTDPNRLRFFKQYISSNQFKIPVDIDVLEARWSTF